MMAQEKVLLVDKNDSLLGVMEKIEAHQKGLLHRAFSVFIINDKGELMLQKRASDKYHSPNLWTNTCCSHQRLGESNIEAGNRRLKEEMGIECKLTEIFSFIYQSDFENGLSEHEYDYVMIGYYNASPKINSNEVNDWKWINISQLKADIASKPQDYTIWFKIIFEKFSDFFVQKNIMSYR